MPNDPDELRQAVERWIRAEWYFRYGPHAYQADEQDRLDQAEVQLRRACCGKGQLASAFARLCGVTKLKENP